jgi:hypothetical protein
MENIRYNKKDKNFVSTGEKRAISGKEYGPWF